MEPTRFVIAGMQRSGTTVTHVCLNGHPDVAMPTDEVYVAPFFTRGLATFTGGKESYKARQDGYRRLFELLTSMRAKDTTRAIGFKTAVGTHHDAIDIANCLREYLPDVLLILVTRDDLVAQCGSLVRAQESGEWHVYEGKRTQPQGDKIAIEPGYFQDYARNCLDAVAQLRTLHATHRVLEFNYERDIVPGNAWGKLFDFLGLPHVPITWLRMQKVAPPPRDFIENYDELCAQLAAMPVSGEAEQLAAAKALSRERARCETGNFLLHRASERLARGTLAQALADIEVALEAGKGLDFALQGQVCALLESAAGSPPEPAAAAAVAAFEQRGAGNAFFLLHRARVRLQKNRAGDAVADLTAMLGKHTRLDDGSLRYAFELLERALEKNGDVAAAQRTVAVLRSGFADNPHFLFLESLVARYAGCADDALALLRKVVAVAPGHERARRMLAE
jgi:tetratricopeptide (TPR) repeat protein